MPFKHDWSNEKMSKKKVYALLVEPNNKPKITKVKEDDKVIKEIAITNENRKPKDDMER